MIIFIFLKATSLCQASSTCKTCSMPRKTFFLRWVQFSSGFDLFILHFFSEILTPLPRYQWPFLLLLETDPGRWLCILTQVSSLFTTSLGNCTFLIPISESMTSFSSHCYNSQARRHLFSSFECAVFECAMLPPREGV